MAKCREGVLGGAMTVLQSHSAGCGGSARTERSARRLMSGGTHRLAGGQRLTRGDGLAASARQSLAGARGRRATACSRRCYGLHHRSLRHRHSRAARARRGSCAWRSRSHPRGRVSARRCRRALTRGGLLACRRLRRLRLRPRPRAGRLRVAARFDRWQRVDGLASSREVRDRLIGNSPRWRAAIRDAIEAACFNRCSGAAHG